MQNIIVGVRKDTATYDLKLLVHLYDLCYYTKLFQYEKHNVLV